MVFDVSVGNFGWYIIVVVLELFELVLLVEFVEIDVGCSLLWVGVFVIFLFELIMVIGLILFMGVFV